MYVTLFFSLLDVRIGLTEINKPVATKKRLFLRQLEALIPWEKIECSMRKNNSGTLKSVAPKFVPQYTHWPKHGKNGAKSVATKKPQD